MNARPKLPAVEPPILHQFKNHLSIIVGFCELLLDELPRHDPKHADIAEMRRAADAAMTLLPQMSQLIAQKRDA